MPLITINCSRLESLSKEKDIKTSMFTSPEIVLFIELLGSTNRSEISSNCKALNGRKGKYIKKVNFEDSLTPYFYNSTIIMLIDILSSTSDNEAKQIIERLLKSKCNKSEYNRNYYIRQRDAESEILTIEHDKKENLYNTPINI